MKFQVMVKILFRLLKVRKVSAAVLAKENGVSERSIYRYVEELIVSGVPLDIIRGRNGGICLPDTYRLPENFFSKDELAAAVNALSALYEQLPTDSVKSALEKLGMQQKTGSRDLSVSGNILVDSGTWGDVYDFSDKLQVFENAIENCVCLDVLYTDRSGQQTRLTSVFHAVFLLASMFLLGGVMARLPLAALAGVLMVTAWRMNDWEGIRYLLSHRFKSGISQFFITMIATVAADLTVAILVGIVYSALLYIVKASHINVSFSDIDASRLPARPAAKCPGRAWPM